MFQGYLGRSSGPERMNQYDLSVRAKHSPGVAAVSPPVAGCTLSEAARDQRILEKSFKMCSKMLAARQLILESCKLPKIPECAEDATDTPMRELPKIVLTDCTIDNNPVSRPIFPDVGDNAEEPSVEDLTLEQIAAVAAQLDTDNDDSFDELPPEPATPANKNLNHRIQTAPAPDDVCLISFLFWTVTSLGILIALGFYGKSEILFSGPINNDVNLKLIPRETWDTNIKLVDKWASYQAKRVIVTHTETEICDALDGYFETVNYLNKQEGVFEYNFLVAPDGYIYEALGWQEPSPLFPGTPTMVIAFIGNYETNCPSEVQITQFQNLLRTSVELTYLIPKYKIEGMELKTEPKQLFYYMSKLENWDKYSYAIKLAIQDLKQYLEMDL